MSPPLNGRVHLIIVGQREHQPEAIIDDVATVVKEEGRTRLLRRCRSPVELIEVVRRTLQEGELISKLDLYDHGKEGVVDMGDRVLFEHTGTGEETAKALREYLTPDARVRLLGCVTAIGEKGRRLLLSLEAWLGPDRVVFGTNHEIVPADFGEGGFKVKTGERAMELLFSSVEARDRESPTQSKRLDELEAGYKPPVE